MHDSATLD